MRTYQEFITEIRRFRLRRSGGDPFTRYSDGKQKPIDLSAIHAAGNADAKASVGYKEKRLKQYRNQETARRMDAAGKKLGLPEEVELDEGMTMKDFKANRQKNKRRSASADAEKRGHVGKEWYNSGRKYSPDEAKRMRSNLDDEERRTRHRSAVEPDNESDDNFSADKTKNPKKLRKQRAMGEHGDRNVQELFITRLSPEEREKKKREKKIATLITLMKHAKDPSADVAKTKK